MARPSRARERRAELTAAAREAVLQRGVIGLRLRDVAEQADMSTSSVHYYFPSLGDLLLEVQREAVERFCVDREEAARREPDPRRRLLGMMRTGVPTSSDDSGFILVLELAMYARRDPAYAAQHIRLCERQIALYASILEAGAATGVFRLAKDPMTIARGFVMLEDGLGLHITQAVPTIDTAQAEQIMLAHASAATGCDLEDFDETRA